MVLRSARDHAGQARELDAQRGQADVAPYGQAKSIHLWYVESSPFETAAVGGGVLDSAEDISMPYLMIGPLIDGLIHAAVAAHGLVLALAFAHGEDIAFRVELHSNLRAVVGEDAAIGNLAGGDDADVIRGQ